MKSLLVQALLFFAIFHAISWFREMTLLDTDGSETVPAITVSLPSGQTTNLAENNNKPTLYYFWAPWCSVCKVSMGNLQAFYQDNKDKFNVVAVALSYDSSREVTDYMEQANYDFDYVLGNVNVSEAFKIQGFPTYYIADEKGVLVSKSMGYSSEIGMQIRSYIL